MKLRWLVLIALFGASVGLVASGLDKTDLNKTDKKKEVEQVEQADEEAVRPTPPPPDRTFKPSEEVSEDFSVPFPTDI